MAIWAFSLPNCQILHQQILKNNCDVLKYLTLPTTKAGGFLFLPLLHWRIPYGTAMSTQCPQAMFILFPYALRYSFYLYADCICSPFFKILIPALIPLLCSAWQFGHSHPDCQIFHQWILISTAGAGLTAWIHCRHFYNLVSVPDRFIQEHSKKLTPRYRTDVLCQFMITHHIFYIQVFYTDRLVFTNQHCRLFL